MIEANPLETDHPRWPASSATSAASTSAWARLGDAQLVLLCGSVLFVLAAWPLLLVALPPFQDLPNHLATAHIIDHPDLYPELGFNGLFKSNALLALWLYLFDGHGLYGAARAFIALVLAANAFALPMFVRHFAGRRAVPVAALLGWPLVHSFSVSMGFLNYAFAFAGSLILLIVLDRQRARPTLAGGLVVAAVAGAVWYAHPFPLAMVGFLVVLHVATRPGWRAKIAAGWALLAPLVPAGLLSLASAHDHLIKPEHSTAVESTFFYCNPLESLEHLWRDVSGAFTVLGMATLLPAVLLPYFAWRRGRVVRPFLSNAGLALMGALYVLLPEMLSNWHYLNCRLVPLLWVGLLIRVPDRLPRAAVAALALAAAAFSLSLGIDYVRLDRDRAEFTAGLDAVPVRSTLLPLMFEHKKTSTFTSSLTHAWGYYTVERDASAPLVFGVERSYPITYRQFPPTRLIPPALDQFAERDSTPAKVCKLIHRPASDPACAVAWRAIWDSFWQEAEPRFTHLLVWAIPPESRSLIPLSYHRVFARGDLEIYARQGASQ